MDGAIYFFSFFLVVHHVELLSVLVLLLLEELESESESEDEEGACGGGRR